MRIANGGSPMKKCVVMDQVIPALIFAVGMTGAEIGRVSHDYCL